MFTFACFCNIAFDLKKRYLMRLFFIVKIKRIAIFHQFGCFCLLTGGVVVLDK